MKDAFTKFSLLMLCVIMVVSVANAAEKGTLKAKVVDVEQGKVLAGRLVLNIQPITPRDVRMAFKQPATQGVAFLRAMNLGVDGDNLLRVGVALHNAQGQPFANRLREL